jgi:hypothetical protein
MLDNPLLTVTPNPNETEVQVKQQQEYKLIGKIRLRKGMKLYSFIPSSGELKEVETLNKASISLKGEPILERRASFDPKAYYIQAINFKNAQRKADKIIYQLLFINARVQASKAKG